jgi:hypothetical protein
LVEKSEGNLKEGNERNFDKSGGNVKIISQVNVKKKSEKQKIG